MWPKTNDMSLMSSDALAVVLDCELMRLAEDSGHLAQLRRILDVVFEALVAFYTLSSHSRWIAPNWRAERYQQNIHTPHSELCKWRKGVRLHRI